MLFRSSCGTTWAACFRTAPTAASPWRETTSCWMRWWAPMGRTAKRALGDPAAQPQHASDERPEPDQTCCSAATHAHTHARRGTRAGMPCAAHTPCLHAARAPVQYRCAQQHRSASQRRQLCFALVSACTRARSNAQRRRHARAFHAASYDASSARTPQFSAPLLPSRTASPSRSNLVARSRASRASASEACCAAMGRGGASHEGRRVFSAAAWQQRLDAVDVRKVRPRRAVFRRARLAVRRAAT